MFFGVVFVLNVLHLTAGKGYRSTIQYDFCGGAKAIRYSVNIALVIVKMTKLAKNRPTNQQKWTFTRII